MIGWMRIIEVVDAWMGILRCVVLGEEQLDLRHIFPVGMDAFNEGGFSSHLRFPSSSSLRIVG